MPCLGVRLTISLFFDTVACCTILDTFVNHTMRWLSSFVFLFLAAASLRSEPASQQAHTFDAAITHAVHLPYLLFLPAAYHRDEQARWPLILYLHGGSLRGGDIERLRSLGLPHKLENEPDFPFVVVSPHCPEGEIWSDADAIAALLDHIMQDCRIDPQRVYVTGHSMGGRGALYLAYRLPSRFAAVLALSPYSPVAAWSDQLARVPLWVFHGTADSIAPISETRELLQRIETTGGHPNFGVLEGRDHFILDVYDRPEIYEWLASHKRPANASPLPSPSI